MAARRNRNGFPLRLASDTKPPMAQKRSRHPQGVNFVFMAWHVVIAGGGFGGFYAARTLEKVLPPQSARITLVNDVNFMLYTPLLPGAAAGTLEPRHVVVPLREELHRTDLRLGQVCSADPDDRCIQVQSNAGHVEDLHYD